MTDAERIDRLERAVATLAWWLVDAQTGFGAGDARGIEAILGQTDDGTRPPPASS